MSASEPPNVACIRKREASCGLNQRRGRSARHLLHHVGGNSGAGIGIENLQIKRTGYGGIYRRRELGARIELRRYRRAILEHRGAIDESSHRSGLRCWNRY